MRLDVYLTENNIYESRKKASDNIKNGYVRVDGRIVTKPSCEVDGTETIEAVGEMCPYVGRGGFKLEKALDEFKIDVSKKVCVDIGASTGGFTDCLLQRGASKVYAIDSGRDQLHGKLKNDCRVCCMEGVNARYLTHEDIGEKCDIAVMDVSFISQTKLYTSVASVLKKGGLFVSLIKPQFEAGKALVGKNGIVKDDKVRLGVCESIKETARLYGLEMMNIIQSPIKGGDGNVEFLALFVLN